jgi:hypothetical protein
VQGDTTAAFESWKRALATSHFDGLRTSVQAALVEHCNRRVAALQATDLSAAFTTVNAARAIVSDPALDKSLSHLYVLRSDQRYENAGRAAQANKPRAEIQKELLGCVEDLRMAVKFDPENRQVAEQLRTRDQELQSFSEQNELDVFLGSKPSLEAITAEIEKLDSKQTPTPFEQQKLAILLNTRAVCRVNSSSIIADEAKATAGAIVRKLFRWCWMPRVPLYLLLPIIIYYTSQSNNTADVTRKVGIVWGIVFLVCLVARNGYRSAFSTFDYRLPQTPMCCGICLRMAHRYDGVPGRGSVNLCDKHQENINSIVTSQLKLAFFFLYVEAAKDAHRALQLWPEFEQAGQTLAAIQEMDPSAVDVAVPNERKKRYAF